MPTPRSLLHLNGANGSTTVTNSVTGGSAVPWAFAGTAGGALTTASPYLGSAMAALTRYQYLASAAVNPVGDWSLGFRIGQTNDSDNGQLAVITQGKSGDPGAWALLMGGDNDLYFFRQGSPDIGIDNSLDSGQATAINNKIKAGNAFMCVQYIGGVLSIGLAGASETSVVKILSGTFTGGSAPAGIIRFNGRFGADGNAYADSGTSRIDEVIFQDGGAIWPTYPFTKPAGEYAFAGAAYELIATPTSFALTAVSAGLVRASLLSAMPAACAVAPVSVNLAAVRVLSGASAIYSASTLQASLSSSRVLAATPGVYAATPGSATMLGSFALGVSTASYAVTPLDVGLARALALSGAPGAFALDARPTALARSFALSAAPASYAAAAPPVSLGLGMVLSATPVACAVTAPPAMLLRGAALTVTPGSYAVTPVDAMMQAFFYIFLIWY